MPYYDRVLGAHLDETAIAPAAIERARELFELSTNNDGDASASDRARTLDQLLAVPGLRAELAIEGEELDRHLLVLEAGAYTDIVMKVSRVADQIEPPVGRPEPVIHTRDNVHIDDVLDLIGDAGIDDDISELGEDETKLPYFWPDRDVMMRTLATVGPLFRETTVRALVEIDRRIHEVSIVKTGVTCRALYTVAATADPDHARRFLELARIAPPALDEVLHLPLGEPPVSRSTPKLDPDRPLVTGSVQQRTLKCYELRNGATTIGLQQALDAVRDPANADRRYDEVRSELYRYLAKHDTEAVRALFLWALREESDDVASSVTYFGWRLEKLVAALPEHIRVAEQRGDTRTVTRMKRLLSEVQA